MLNKAMKEVNKRAKHLDVMIENADEMVPKKKGGPLDASDIWSKKPGKIMGMEAGEAIPNKYLKRFKGLVGKE